MATNSGNILPANLTSLHAGEEQLREKALALIAADERLELHLAITEAAMDLADILRQFDTTDEDLKVLQILGMRSFNALGQASSSRCQDIARTVRSSFATYSRRPFSSAISRAIEV